MRAKSGERNGAHGEELAFGLGGAAGPASSIDWFIDPYVRRCELAERLCIRVPACHLSPAGLASERDGDCGLVARRHRAHVSRVRRTGMLGAREQEAVAVSYPTRLREPRHVGPRARTRVRAQLRRAAPAGV